MIYTYRYRIVTYICLGALFLGVFKNVLPTENIDFLFFAAFCIAGYAAIKKGQPHTGVISLIGVAVLIQISINLFGLNPLTKIANGVMFLFVVFRYTGSLPIVKKEARNIRQTQSKPKTQHSNPRASVKSVFEDFQKFTAKSDDDNDGATKEPKGKAEYKPRRRRSSRKPHSDRNGQNTHEQKYKARPKSDDDKERNRTRSNKSKDELRKAQEALQAEQHALQREKQKLQEQAEQAERERQATEAKFRREAEVLKKERDNLKHAQASPKNDLRSPEEILGLPSSGYTLQELKEARNREAKRWNPSNMRNKPTDLVRQAEEELKKINVSFDKLKKKIG